MVWRRSAKIESEHPIKTNKHELVHFCPCKQNTELGFAWYETHNERIWATPENKTQKIC